MNKKLKEILKNSKVSVKWEKTKGGWDKEKFNNLLEWVEKEKEEDNMKIRLNRTRGLGEEWYLITWSYRYQKIETLTYVDNLELDLCIMLVQRCIFLGKLVKIKTSLGNFNF